MAENKISSEDRDLSESIRIQFDESYSAALPHLKRLEKMQAAYECQTPETWETFSQIFLPHFRTAVEQALPDAFNYLLPKSGMLEIVPNGPMTFAQTSAVRDYYEQLVMRKIGLKKHGLLTLKDCMKLNIGYGEVTTQIVTPMDATANTIFGGGEARNIRRMDMGTPREVIQYKYVDWRTVIPTPDGGTPDDVSGIFRLKGIREDVFLDMYRADALLDEPMLKGDPNAIIQSVRDGRTSLSHFPLEWIMGSFGTTDNVIKSMRKLNDINRRMRLSARSPVKIPVLMCEFNREHVWLVPDGTVIYHLKDKIQTFRKSIVKATACPDGESWYPMGDAGSSFDATEGSNILQNAIVDLLSYKLHPATVVNRSMITDKNAVIEPYAQLDAYGKAGDAAAVIQGPQIDQSMFNIGAQFEQQIALANGQPMNLQGSGTAGVMRGGGGAFESFLQTTQARSKLAGAVIQTGWLEEVVNNVIILSQIIGQDDKYIYKDGLSGKYVEKTITAQDIMHSFQAVVDLDDKFHSSPSERAMDISLYMQVYKDNPKVDQDAALEEVTGNREKWKKLKATPELEAAQLKALQERMAAAEAAKAQAAQGAQGGGQNPGTQAMQGAGSQRAVSV